MARRSKQGKFIISAGEVGAFTVCPEAWRLMMVERVNRDRQQTADEGLKLHAQWATKCAEQVDLGKIALAVTALLGAALCLHAILSETLLTFARFNDVGFLILIIVACGYMLRRLSMSQKKAERESGLRSLSPAVSIDGTQSLPVPHYVSEVQGLAGKPDALIMEHGFVIPVERKPLARKLRDRYVAQILVYLRLIEEIDGKRPPYGYLILGPSCRRIKIENSPERQQWAQGYLDQMRGYLEQNVPVIPLPHQKKCAKCDVQAHCKYAFGSKVVGIGKVENR